MIKTGTVHQEWEQGAPGEDEIGITGRFLLFAVVLDFRPLTPDTCVGLFVNWC